jgi:hypothetical protein
VYWSQVMRDSARKRGDKRLSVELIEDAGCVRICDHWVGNHLKCAAAQSAKASRSGNL